MLGAFVPFLALAVGVVPARPGELPRVVFSSERDGNIDLYVARTDGTGLQRLTNDPAPDQFPRCSPDRRSIVFVRGDAAAAELYRLDLADGSQRRLTDNAVRDSTPEWSPDGGTIYFTRRDGAHDRLAAMRADGSGARFLTDGAAHDTMPAVSPDGLGLAHHTYRYGRDTELHLIDLVSGTSARLTALSGSDYEASFAGSDQLLFSSNFEGGHFRLYVLNLASRDVRLLADTGSDAWGARYSTATGNVLFYTGTRGSWRLMRVALTGGAVEPVIADGHSNSGPDWC